MNDTEREVGFFSFNLTINDVWVLELLQFGGDESHAEAGARERDDTLCRGYFDDFFRAERSFQTEGNDAVVLKRSQFSGKEDKGLVLQISYLERFFCAFLRQWIVL